MTEATETNAIATTDNENETKDAKIAKIKQEIATKMQADLDFINSDEAAKMMAEIAKLSKGPKSKATKDPALVEEENSVKEYLFGEEDGWQKKAQEKLNSTIAEMYPLLAEKGASVSVVIKLKGMGRGSAGPRTGAPRLVHRTTDGMRCKDVNKQGMPSLKDFIAKYPDQEAEIMEKVGTGDLRKALYEEASQDKTVIFVELSDGTGISLQS